MNMVNGMVAGSGCGVKSCFLMFLQRWTVQGSLARSLKPEPPGQRRTPVIFSNLDVKEQDLTPPKT